MEVLLVQLAPRGGDLAANAERVRAVLAGADADLVVFPELFLSGYRLERLDEVALDRNGGEIEALREAARAAGAALIVGAVEAAGRSFFNTALCIDADGSLVASHRKTHLFGGERRPFAAGAALDPVVLAGHRVGVMICFELEFPEVARTLACRGAELLVTVSANMDPYGPDHDLFSRARAVENNLPHLYVNRVGSESGLRFCGGTRVLAATGETIVAAGNREETISSRLPAAISRTADTAYLEQRRPALYGCQES